MVKIYDPVQKMSEFASTEAEIEWLGSGYGGHDENGTFLGVAEGPVWYHQENYLIFSDNGQGRRYRWSEAAGMETIHFNTNNANGLTRDPTGRLICCEHTSRRVTRVEPDGSITVVADNYRGLRLNRPNDVVTDAEGAIYFTDPMTFGVETELDFAGVYRVSPDLGTINLLVRDFAMPNGLVFSLDESVMYINDTARMHVRAFDIDRWAASTPRLNLATDRVLIHMSGSEAGAPDGMKVDARGWLWCTGPGGVWVIDAHSGEHIGTIFIPGDVTNFTFGGPDLDMLYFTTYTKMGRLQITAKGPKVPRNF